MSPLIVPKADSKHLFVDHKMIIEKTRKGLARHPQTSEYIRKTNWIVNRFLAYAFFAALHGYVVTIPRFGKIFLEISYEDTKRKLRKNFVTVPDKKPGLRFCLRVRGGWPQEYGYVLTPRKNMQVFVGEKLSENDLIYKITP